MYVLGLSQISDQWDVSFIFIRRITAFAVSAFFFFGNSSFVVVREQVTTSLAFGMLIYTTCMYLL